MHQTAQASDFQRLSGGLQQAHLEVLEACDRLRLSCRCEMIGRDFTIIIGRGMSSPKYWLDLFRQTHTP